MLGNQLSPHTEASFEAPPAVPVLLIGEAELDGGGLCRPGIGGGGQGLVEPQGVLGGAGVDFRGSLGLGHAFHCGWEEERVSLSSFLSEASSEQKTINIPFGIDPGEVLLHGGEPGTNHIACRHSQWLARKPLSSQSWHSGWGRLVGLPIIGGALGLWGMPCSGPTCVSP